MRLLIISSNYPYEARPYHGAFVQDFVRTMARLGVICTVIRPLSFFDRRHGKLAPLLIKDEHESWNPIEVWSPRYLSTSARNILSFNTNSITQLNFERAVAKIAERIEALPDLVYGHFLYPGGAAAVKLASELKLPSVVAVGDSTLEEHFTLVPLAKAIHHFEPASAMASVSYGNKIKLEEYLGISPDAIRVFPNGVNLSLFRPRNRRTVRSNLGLPLNRFIVAFTGHFNQRKGPDRLLAAIEGLENVGAIFIGAGPIELESEHILFKGALPRESVAELLSAADIFALPTLAEGSCNAILEAMACGLPVVTSKGEFNDEIVDDHVAVRVDPMSVIEIRAAIKLMSSNHRLRSAMSENAVLKARKYDLQNRGRSMLEWLETIKARHDQQAVEV